MQLMRSHGGVEKEKRAHFPHLSLACARFRPTLAFSACLIKWPPTQGTREYGALQATVLFGSPTHVFPRTHGKPCARCDLVALGLIYTERQGYGDVGCENSPGVSI